MKLDELVSLTIGRLMGRMLRRTAVIAALALCLLVALYHLTIAGTFALEETYGPLRARLIVVGAYATLAAIFFAYLLATRAKAPAATPRSNASRQSRDVQIAKLLESLLVGYTAGRGKSGHS